jgi:hypothetical protein
MASSTRGLAGLDRPLQMISVDFGVIRIVEYHLTGRRNVSHDGAPVMVQHVFDSP